jgi:hypothetical protein
MMHDEPLCPSCLHPLAESAHVCSSCGARITTFATTDPTQIPLAEGAMVRGAIQNPSLIVLVGTWLLYGLPCLFFVLMFVMMIMEGGGNVIDWVIGCLLLGFAIALYAAIVRRVTAAYLAKHRHQ